MCWDYVKDLWVLSCVLFWGILVCWGWGFMVGGEGWEVCVVMWRMKVKLICWSG